MLKEMAARMAEDMINKFFDKIKEVLLTAVYLNSTITFVLTL